MPGESAGRPRPDCAGRVQRAPSRPSPRRTEPGIHGSDQGPGSRLDIDRGSALLGPGSRQGRGGVRWGADRGRDDGAVNVRRPHRCGAAVGARLSRFRARCAADRRASRCAVHSDRPSQEVGAGVAGQRARRGRTLGRASLDGDVRSEPGGGRPVCDPGRSHGPHRRRWPIRAAC
jgi:hypothetical protein